MTIEFTVPYPVRKSAWTKRYGLKPTGRERTTTSGQRTPETLRRLCGCV